ncbi:hypothetical protein DFP72DRAFT_830146, partial [Ephemerocybe angulata]
MEITPAICEIMPYWWHPATKSELVSIYSDKWGRCLRQTHGISTVGEMLHHANKNRSPNCSERVNCSCVPCVEDRAQGCEHPPKCRRNAMKKLHNLEDEWNPVIDREVREHGYPNGDEIPGWTEAGFTTEIVRHPLQLIRIFASVPQDVPVAVIAAPHLNDVDSGTATNVDDVSVWTDGSCTENGSKYAKAGSGLWYAANDARNQAIRLPGEYLTNNTAELAAMLLS